jgi:hypothetical protein
MEIEKSTVQSIKRAVISTSSDDQDDEVSEIPNDCNSSDEEIRMESSSELMTPIKERKRKFSNTGSSYEKTRKMKSIFKISDE